MISCECVVCWCSAIYQTWNLLFPFLDHWSGLLFLKKENRTRSLVSGIRTSFAIDVLCDLGKGVSPL